MRISDSVGYVLLVAVVLFSLGAIIVGNSGPKDESEHNEEPGTEEEQETYRFSSERYEESNYDSEIDILTDSETGCQYIIHGGSKFTSGMSVLLDEYGNPTGCNSIDNKEEGI